MASLPQSLTNQLLRPVVFVALSITFLIILQGGWVLSTLSIGLVLGVWLVVGNIHFPHWRWVVAATGVFLVAGVLANGLSMPQTRAVALFGLSGALIFVCVQFIPSNRPARKPIALAAIYAIIALLVFLKLPATSSWLGNILGQPAHDISVRDLEWVGISYLALRLIAMLIDFRRDLLPENLSFSEVVIYALFPPSLLAGPIDVPQRFIPEWRENLISSQNVYEGLQRIVIGAFKKFIIADSLAPIALSPMLADDVNHTLGAWVLLYIFAWYLFFDFSGYSDMAIGAGMLLGIKLPENFNRPYLQRNLALFWRNWHMSLTTWFRTYCFSPLSRSLLRRKLPISEYFISQAATMLLIGAWHGITWNFLLWGLWHAVGLYGLRRLTTLTNRWQRHQAVKRSVYMLGVLATFHYVALGWVFFALETPQQSLDYLRILFTL